MNRKQRRKDAGINKKGLHNSGKGNLLLVGSRDKQTLSFQRINGKTITHLS